MRIKQLFVYGPVALLSLWLGSGVAFAQFTSPPPSTSPSTPPVTPPGTGPTGTPGITESDTTALTTFSVVGDPGHTIQATRVGSDGRRVIKYADASGNVLASFLDDPSVYPMTAIASASASSGQTAVCTEQATGSLPSAPNYGVRCAVIPTGGASFGSAYLLAGPSSARPHAFLADICPGAQGHDFGVLVKYGTNPIADDYAALGIADKPACNELFYSKTSGWTLSQASVNCACNAQPGAACTDPCYQSPGVVGSDGTCDFTHVAPACPDGSVCTGVTDGSAPLCDDGSSTTSCGLSQTACAAPGNCCSGVCSSGLCQ